VLSSEYPSDRVNSYILAGASLIQFLRSPLNGPRLEFIIHFPGSTQYDVGSPPPHLGIIDKGELMQRSATAVWTGTLKEGNGRISTPSGVLKDAPYSFLTRFENGKGTNPEELLGAAHAACFAMALSAQLSTMNFMPQSIQTTATLSLEKLDAGWTISKIHLDLCARIPGITQAAFESAAVSAKANCPVSRLFKAEISLTAVLEPVA
jgi:lipoyl-dependent peroxiredoxin